MTRIVRNIYTFDSSMEAICEPNKDYTTVCVDPTDHLSSVEFFKLFYQRYLDYHHQEKLARMVRSPYYDFHESATEDDYDAADAGYDSESSFGEMAEDLLDVHQRIADAKRAYAKRASTPSDTSTE